VNDTHTKTRSSILGVVFIWVWEYTYCQPRTEFGSGYVSLTFWVTVDHIT